MVVLSTMSKDPQGRTEQRVSGRNREYAFSLWRPGEGGSYTIRALEEVKGPGQALRSSPRGMVKTILSLPFSASHAIIDLISNPRFRLRSISSVVSDGKRLVRVEFDWDVDTKPV